MTSEVAPVAKRQRIDNDRAAVSFGDIIPTYGGGSQGPAISTDLFSAEERVVLTANGKQILNLTATEQHIR